MLLYHNYFILRFTGVFAGLTCRISDDGRAGIYLHDNSGEYWDIITDFDLEEKQNEDGKLYCALCLEPQYYPSRPGLWEQHVFELLLEWANNNFTRHTYICLYGVPGVTSWGTSLCQEGHFLRKDYCRCFPVLTGQF